MAIKREKSRAPQRKVTSTLLASALTTIIIGALRRKGIELTAEEAGASITIIGFLVGYFVPEKQD